MFPNKLQSIESVVFAEAVAAESTQDVCRHRMECRSPVF